MKPLVVIDMQKDFVDGALGTAEAHAIAQNVADLMLGWDGPVICTLDTHHEDYLNTLEGHYLPVEHCIEGSAGWRLCLPVAEAAEQIDAVLIAKPAFGSLDLPEVIEDMCGGEPDEIHIVGICTDICVISNAMILKAAFTEVPVFVHRDYCAGVTPEQHENALSAMGPCQIEVV